MDRSKPAEIAERLRSLLNLKRLRKIKDGLLVSSDNPAYPPERYVKEECDRIQIFGRALHASREL